MGGGKRTHRLRTRECGRHRADAGQQTDVANPVGVLRHKNYVWLLSGHQSLQSDPVFIGASFDLQGLDEVGQAGTRVPEAGAAAAS